MELNLKRPSEFRSFSINHKSVYQNIRKKSLIQRKKVKLNTSNIQTRRENRDIENIQRVNEWISQNFIRTNRLVLRRM